MINTLIAYDDNDLDLGDYFEATYARINEVISELPSIRQISIRGLDCTFAGVSEPLNQINANRFIFVGATHGNDQSLVNSQEEAFVNASNSALFNNSFFYSTACCIGNDLAYTLIQNGTMSFVGYENISKAPSDEKFDQLFIDCELHGLINFFTTNNSIEKIYMDMIEEFRGKVNTLFEQNEIITAIELEENCDSLIILGNGHLTKNDFNIDD